MLRSLLRLQALAFVRAPHLGGRAVLAALRTLGIAYAVFASAALGFLLPDTLSVWAPEVSALTLVGQALLPALGLLTVGRVLFQDVPTRGAEAFLLTPVPRRRVARAVTLRATLSVFNVAPLAFAVPFALRTIRGAEGDAAAAAFVVGMAALVAVSHFAVVVWKTRLGAAPGATAAAVGAAAVATPAGVFLAGGPLGPNAALATTWAAGVALALGRYAHRGVVGALYLDIQGESRATGGARTTRGGPARRRGGFERPGVSAFLDLEWRLVTRTRFPRGVVLNALAMTLAITGYAFAFESPTALLLLFATGTVAIALGQFALPFASGHYDRLLTLPGALRAFVAAKLALVVGATGVLGAVQGVLALVFAPEALPDLGAAVLFCAGVMAPVAVLGSTLAPKPFDVDDTFMGNTRVQALPPQVAIALAAAAAVGPYALAGPEAGRVAMSVLGAAGLAGLPLWARVLRARVRRRRHAVAARFRSDL